MARRFSAGVCAVFVLGIRAYQRFLSPLFPPTCRFYPTCSAYAVEALQRHGALRGSWYALRRFLRCHPWNGGGPDPVPPSPKKDVSPQERISTHG